LLCLLGLDFASPRQENQLLDSGIYRVTEE
jgi:hypothetical protein